MSLPLRIVKVGGSLLSLPDLAARLQHWLSQQPEARNVLLAGGGLLADAIRTWDERFQLGEETSHWLCVDLLDVMAGTLHQILKKQGIVCQLSNSLEQLSAAPLLVFAPAQFLREQESGLAGCKLPHSWQATSDSIAARLAEVCQADELVLLKSSPPSATFGDSSGSGEGYVDEHFPHATRNTPSMRFFDLRAITDID